MSAVELLVIQGGKRKRRISTGLTPNFQALEVGADALTIAQGGSGAGAYFDLAAREVRSTFPIASYGNNTLATKEYVDLVRVAARIIGNIRVAATGNITLSGLQTIDGYAVVAGDRVLAPLQTNQTQNGVYIAAAGAWTRATDLDNSPIGEIYNGVLTAAVLSGTANIGKNYVITSVGTGVDGAHILGTDNIVFSVFTTPTQLTSGAGTTLNGNAIDVDPGEGIRIAADAVAVDFAVSKTNDNAGAISQRQVVYIKADGDVDLAAAGVANLDSFDLGLVEDASIAAAASGRIAVKQGKIMGGFTGLTPGQAYYVSKATPGAIELFSAISWAAGDFVYRVGRAISATELRLDPEFEYEY